MRDWVAARRIFRGRIVREEERFSSQVRHSWIEKQREEGNVVLQEVEIEMCKVSGYRLSDLVRQSFLSLVDMLG